MVLEADAGAVATDEPSGDVDTDESDVLEPEVADEPEGDLEAEADAEPTEGAPEADPWKGVSWRHRQAAERAKRDAGWATKAGPDVLEGLAGAHDELGRQFAALGRMETDVAAPTAPETAPKPKAEPAAAQAGDFAFDVPALEAGMEVPDEFKKGVLEPLQGRIQKYDQYEQRVAKLEAFYAQAQQREKQAEETRALEQLDQVVAAPEMGDFAELYGVGPTLSMDMNGAPAKARAELAGMAYRLFLGAKRAGQSVELPAAFRWAHSIVNADKIAAAERDKGRKETDALKRTATRRPATRTAAPEEKTEAEERAEAVDFARGLWRRVRGKK